MPNDPNPRADALRRFAADALAARPRPPGLDRAAFFAAAQAGVFKDLAPGAGATATAATLAALGEGGAERGLLFAIGAHLFGGLVPLLRYGTPAQRARWEPGMRDGSLVAALAVTEPDGGSSFNDLTTMAVSDGDSFRLDGRKRLITNAPDADLFVVLARQFPERGPMGLTMFLVSRNTPSIAVQSLATGGLAGAPMGEVTFADCRPGPDAVLGQPGAGLKVFVSAMVWERSLLLAGFLGAAEYDLRATVKALSTRANGAALKHQAVTHRIARMRLRLAAARLLIDQSAQSLDAGREDTTLAAMAKLAASEAARDCAADIAHLLAGSGWTGTPFDAAAVMADVQGGLFASGTSEIQLDIIARQVIAAARRP